MRKTIDAVPGPGIGQGKRGAVTHLRLLADGAALLAPKKHLLPKWMKEVPSLETVEDALQLAASEHSKNHV